jgi:L-rhamnose mutarotase
MVRVAWTGRLRPDKIETYVEAHANVWPDVLDAIRAAGIRDYSVFLFGDRVFGTYECDDPERSQAIEEAAEATQRWRAWMRELFDEEVTLHGPTWLTEVFRLE